MQSICWMCGALGAWLEKMCERCQGFLGRTAAQRGQRRTPGETIPPDVRKWTAELFASIEELKHNIAELDHLDEER